MSELQEEIKVASSEKSQSASSFAENEKGDSFQQEEVEVPSVVEGNNICPFTGVALNGLGAAEKNLIKPQEEQKIEMIQPPKKSGISKPTKFNLNESFKI